MSTYTDEDVARLTTELAQRAEISQEKAERVMRLLHLHLLPGISRAQETVLRDRNAVGALGLSHAEVEKRLSVRCSDVSVDDLRLTIKPSRMAAIMV